MGFVGEVLDNVKNIHIYYIIGIFIFLVLFVVILIRTIRIPKTELVKMKTAILDNQETENMDEHNLN
jgi:hypothetical protein